MIETPIILKNVGKKYNGSAALNSITFSIDSNESVALVGNNGSGKTTTINILCNIIPYDKGEVNIYGRRLTSNYVSYRSRLGAYLSDPILIKEFTPSQYLSFVGKFHKMKQFEIQNRCEELFRVLNIEDAQKKKISDYSLGNQVKISLCAALIHNPDLLILDEPFVHLDIQSLDTVKEILRTLVGKKTMLITSHNLELIISLCTRILVLDKGVIIHEIHNNFNNIDELKNLVKSKLILNDQNISLEWLS